MCVWGGGGVREREREKERERDRERMCVHACVRACVSSVNYCYALALTVTLSLPGAGWALYRDCSLSSVVQFIL